MERSDDRGFRAGRARAASTAASAGAYLDAATRARGVHPEHVVGRAGRLLRRYRDGDAAIDAYAEDYAYLVWGLLELFQAGGDPQWLEWALTLQAQQDEKFWDAQDGGWFSTTGEDPTVLLRLKEDYDGAEPAASSIAALNALTICASDRRRRSPRRGPSARSRATVRASAPPGGTIPMMLCALSAWHAGLSQVVIVGDARPCRGHFVEELARHYLPFAIVIPVAPGTAQRRLGALLAVHRGDDRSGQCGGIRLPRLHLPPAGHDGRRPRGATMKRPKKRRSDPWSLISR